MGKFYEAFHMDADIIVRECDTVYMRGSEAHAGFPEISYAWHSERLVAAGYRVARVEQTETPEELKERNAKRPDGVPAYSVVERKLCGIKSKGTRVMSSVVDFLTAPAPGATQGAGGGGGGGGGRETVYDPVYSSPDSRGGATGVNSQTSGSFLYALKEMPLTEEGSMEEEDVPGEAEVNGGAGEAAGAASSGRVLMAVVSVDCSTGEIRLAEFVDDPHRSRLRTLLARFPAGEFLTERGDAGGGGGAGPLSKFTSRVLLYDAPGAIVNELIPKVEFLSASDTADELDLKPYAKFFPGPDNSGATPPPSSSVIKGEEISKGGARLRDYFSACDSPQGIVMTADSSTQNSSFFKQTARTSAPDGVSRMWPSELAALVERASGDGFQASPSTLWSKCDSGSRGSHGEGFDVPPSSLALSALGALLHWLRRCQIDHQVLSMKRVSVYKHADGGSQRGGNSASTPAAGRGEGNGVHQQHLVLDGNTLLNLDLLENGVDGGRKGTLLGLLDTTSTAMGRRLFRQWLSAPLFDPLDINDRLNAVENLMHGWESDSGGLAHLKTLRDSLRGLPDLPRLLARIHGLGSRTLAVDHPDAKAQFYESASHDKRKIGDFLATIRAFRAAAGVRALFHLPVAQGKEGPAQNMLPGVTSPMLQRLGKFHIHTQKHYAFTSIPHQTHAFASIPFSDTPFFSPPFISRHKTRPRVL